MEPDSGSLVQVGAQHHRAYVVYCMLAEWSSLRGSK